MADIITREQLENASLDSNSLELFISGSDIDEVITRLGQQYPTLAKLVRILMETGGWKAYLTEAALLATTPTVNPSVGYAFDTKKLYLWNGTTWIDEGLSQFDQAVKVSLDSLRTLESNRPQNPNKLDFKQVTFLTAPTSIIGTATYPYRNGLKQLKLVSSTSGTPITVYWELPASQFLRDFSGSITIEGLTSGSNGVVGIEQRNDAGSLISTHYAATGVIAAVTKQTYKVSVPSVTAGATKIRLIVNMLTTGTREMYVHSPFIADGANAEFIAPRDTRNENLILSAFIKVNGKNQFNKALAEDAKTIDYKTGVSSVFANGIAFGKQAVQAGGAYIYWMPLSVPFAFERVIYTYDKNGVFLGLDRSMTGNTNTETVNTIDPPRNHVFSDSDKTVSFTIPDNSRVAFIQMRLKYATHTSTDFNSIVNGMQLELGALRTDYVAYDPNGQEIIYLKKSSLLDTPDSGSGSTVVATGNTFSVYVDDTYAYMRNSFSDTQDKVQLVRYGTNDKWNNNVINPVSTRLIPKSTSKENLISAYNSGVIVIPDQGDDAAPLNYNGHFNGTSFTYTYIGANHGAIIAHKLTHVAHGKDNRDVGSIWTVDGRQYTIVRIIDANSVWAVSENSGTESAWIYNTISLSGKTLTHVSGATNTANIVVSAYSLEQLMSAVNNHVKKVVIDGYKTVTTAGYYDVESIEFFDTYDIINIPSLITYLQAHVGTATEQIFSSLPVSSDVTVQVSYRYALNGAVTVNTQLSKNEEIDFNFAGGIQALPIGYTGKTLLQYVPKLKPITVSGTTYDLTNIVDVTAVTARIDFLKSSWLDENNPPDRMAQIVKNGSTKEYGFVIGYGLTRGSTRPSIRKNVVDAGFWNNGSPTASTKKMYPKALVGTLNTVINMVAYRLVFNPNILPEATVYGWYQDNNDIFVVLDIHQNVSKLRLPDLELFNGKSATIVEAHDNFTLHSEIVSDGGLLCSVVNGYAQATIKLS